MKITTAPGAVFLKSRKVYINVASMYPHSHELHSTLTPAMTLTLTPKETLHPHAYTPAMTLTYTHALSQQLTQALTQLYPDTQQHRHNTRSINRCIRNHLETIVADMHEIYTSRRHRLYASYYTMMIREYRVRWGRITLNGKKQWVSEVLQPWLYLIIYKGHVGMPSAVEIKNPVLLDAIHAYASIYNPAPVVPISSNVMLTKVNSASLQRFQDNVLNDTSQRRVAKQILNSLDAYDRLHQDIKMPVEDRTYLKGLNLQTTAKELRSAALAGQYSYDANCMVFALFASVAHTLTGKPYETLLWYVHDRTTIRQDIADQTGLTVEEVKQTLTAAGFGQRAKGTNNLKVIMTTDIGKKLIKEFRKASCVIFKHFKQEGTTRGKQLAKLFRTWETELMSQFIKHSNQEANLTIHDCVIFLNPVNIKHVLPKISVSFTTHMEYFAFEETLL